MKAFCVELKKAEQAKRELLEKNIYDKDYLPKKDKRTIFFPVKKKEKIDVEGKFVETELEKTDNVKSYKELLENLSENQKKNLPSSYDIIGDIIILEVPEELEKIEEKIANALLETHRGVKTILKKAGIHRGEFRTQKLDFLAGENKKETTYTENNTKLKLDVEKTYFSPRLSTERKRIFEQVRQGEKILVMFSGVGPYPLTISKNTNAKKIIGIEKNPLAHKYALQNKKINKTKNVDFIEGDVREIIPKINEMFDRIIMPLPKDAEKYLDLVPKVAKNNCVVHLYVFDEKEKKAENTIKKECKKQNLGSEIIKSTTCGQYSPSTHRICVDFKVHAH